MNSLYTLGLRQSSSLQADLERLRGGDASIGLQGQISASLAAFNRTIDDYDSMAKREVIKTKQEKAYLRVQKFRSDYMDLRKSFDQAKREADNARAQSQRADLFQTPDGQPPVARHRFAQQVQAQDLAPESPFNLPPMSSRENHALNEHTFLQETETQLDNFLAQGQEVLNNLVDQRHMLKGTQKRLLDAANTLGLSRDVIGWIEKRSREDMIIFGVGAVFTFFCFWAIWHYLG